MNAADACDAIVHEAMERRQLLPEEVQELRDHIAQHRDFVNGWFAVEFVAGELRVSLHDRVIRCTPDVLAAALDAAG